MVNVFQNGGEIARELIETRCHRGAEIARKMRFSEGGRARHPQSRRALGRQRPAARPARRRHPGLFAHRADGAGGRRVPDRQRHRGARCAKCSSRAGTWFDPRLVAALRARRRAAGILGDAALARSAAGDLRARAGAAQRLVDEDYLDDIAAAFAQVVDSKSPYTSGHSERVTLFTDMIAEQLGLAAERRRWLKRAALLHDIGKLGVSNSILDKPGKLDADGMGGDEAARGAIPKRSCRASRRSRDLARDRRRASRAARRQGLSARARRRRDRARNPHHHDRGHLRRADRRPALPGRDAGVQGAGDHVRHGRHADRRRLLRRAARAASGAST